MTGSCGWRPLDIGLLAAMPFVLTAAGWCAWMAWQLRQNSEQARIATRNAVLLTSRVVAQAAPWLECGVCGRTLDPRAGVGIGLDADGQLRLRCHEHQDAEL